VGFVSRVGSLGSVLPVALVEPDGLIVTTDGRYVRLLECEQVPNTITADGGALAQVERAFAHVCRLIGDRQRLVIYAQTDPVPIDDAMLADQHATATAAGQDRRDGHHELASARERLLAATAGGSRSPTSRLSPTSAHSYTR